MNIRKLLAPILLALAGSLAPVAHAEVWQARYGVAEIFNFKLYNADGTLDVDEADGGTEVSVSCNEGAETTATNDFVDEGNFYSISLTATEMQCERIAVVVAATTTEVFFIQTSANASAFTPTYEANVASVTAGAITAAAIATGAVDADAVAADVSTELLTGLANLSVNVAQISTDSGAADTLETWLDGTTGPAQPLGIARQGTAQSATGTTLVLDASSPFADDTPIGMTLWACGSTQGYCQSQAITDYVNATDTATVAGWPVTPSGTITYYVYGTAPGASGSLTAADVWAHATRSLTILDEDTTTLDLNATVVGSLLTFDEDSTTIDINATPTGAAASVTGAVGSVTGSVGSVTGAVGSVTGAVGSVTGNVGGNVVGSVASVTAGVTITTNNDKTGYTLSAAGINGLRDVVIEDQGGGVSLACALSAILAYAAGDVATAAGTSTYEDASGTETRIVGTVVTAGNRTATITCPTL
jgi:hypothetical protein